MTLKFSFKYSKKDFEIELFCTPAKAVIKPLVTIRINYCNSSIAENLKGRKFSIANARWLWWAAANPKTRETALRHVLKIKRRKARRERNVMRVHKRRLDFSSVACYWLAITSNKLQRGRRAVGCSFTIFTGIMRRSERAMPQHNRARCSMNFTSTISLQFIYVNTNRYNFVQIFSSVD